MELQNKKLVIERLSSLVLIDRHLHDINYIMPKLFDKIELVERADRLFFERAASVVRKYLILMKGKTSADQQRRHLFVIIHGAFESSLTVVASDVLKEWYPEYCNWGDPSHAEFNLELKHLALVKHEASPPINKVNVAMDSIHDQNPIFNTDIGSADLY